MICLAPFPKHSAIHSKQIQKFKTKNCLLTIRKTASNNVKLSITTITNSRLWGLHHVFTKNFLPRSSSSIRKEYKHLTFVSHGKHKYIHIHVHLTCTSHTHSHLRYWLVLLSNILLCVCFLLYVIFAGAS